jgi:hypothetical protein
MDLLLRKNNPSIKDWTGLRNAKVSMPEKRNFIFPSPWGTKKIDGKFTSWFERQIKPKTLRPGTLTENGFFE